MKLEDFQKIEQTKSLYRKTTPVLLITSISVCSLVLVTLWHHFSAVFMLAWYCFAITILLLRHNTKRAFTSINVSLENYQPWLKKLLIYSFLLGLSWGTILLFAVNPNHLVDLVVLTTIYCILTSTNGYYLGVYFPAYLAFAIPTLFLFIIKLIYIGGSSYNIFASLIILHFVFISSLARKTHAASNQVSKLTYQNQQLYDNVVIQKEVAENAVLAKDQFLAAASHDLRQPLHAQGLFITALQYSNLPDQAQKLLQKVKLSSDALNGLLNGLLDISRLDSNNLQNEPQELELKPLLHQIHQQYFDYAAENETELVLDCHNGIHVYCDENLLVRLIRNLVDNAVKFTHNGKITLKTSMQEKRVLLSIIDTGKGIPEDQQENIFNEFTQLNNPERDRQKGLGLGLAIVKRISNLMAIPLELKSKAGKGTTFTLNIPLSKSQQPVIDLSLNQNQTTDDFLKSEVVLVIDDEEDICAGMKLIIEQWHAKVVTATSAKKAIAELDHQGLQPSFIISDFRLRKGKNGIDAINLIRKEFNAPIKAILITGDTSSERITMAEEIDLPLLFKPVDPDILRNAIAETLSIENDH